MAILKTLVLLTVVLRIGKSFAAHAIYIDSENGQDNPSCGTKIFPCQHLEYGIKMVSSGGYIRLNGVHILSKTIILAKNISISNWMDELPLIADKKQPIKSYFAFTMNRIGLYFSITNVTFSNIAVVRINPGSTVTVRKCQLQGFKKTEAFAFKTFQNVILHIMDSFFSNALNLFRHYQRKQSLDATNEIYLKNVSLINMSGFWLSHDCKMNLTIVDCRFHRFRYGIVALDRGTNNKTSTLNIHRTILSNSLSHIHAVSAMNYRYFKFTNSTLKNILYSTTGSTTLKEIQDVSITSSRFINYGSIAMRKIRTLTITKCSFFNSTAPRLRWVFMLEDVQNSTIAYSVFYRNRAKKRSIIYMSGINKSVMYNNIFRHNHGIVITTNFINEFSIKRCSFLDNTVSQLHGVLLIQRVIVSRIETIYFRRNTARCGGVLEIIYVNVSVVTNSDISNNSNAYGGAMYLQHVNDSAILLSKFVNNSGNLGGSIVFFDDINSSVIEKCEFNSNVAEKVGGAISISSPSLNGIIKNCRFKSNQAGMLGDAIYNVGNLTIRHVKIEGLANTDSYILHSQIGSMNLENVALKMTENDTAFRRSVIPMIFVASSFDALITHGTQVQCPINHNIGFQNNSYESYKFSGKYSLFIIQCKSCKKGTYSIKNSSIKFHSMSKAPNVEENKCFLCPDGGICDNGLIAMDNYWGYKNNKTQQVNFIPCLDDYCCSSKTIACGSYQVCNYGRKGTLCGACVKNLTRDIFTKECFRRTFDCNVGYFCLYFVIYSFLYPLFWIYVKTAFNGIKTFFSICKKKTKQDLSRHTGIALFSVDHTSSVKSKESSFSLFGALKLIFFYYQIVSLLKVQGHDSDFSSFATLLKNWISRVSNFRLIVYANICPAETVDILQIELYNFGLRLSFFASLALLCGISKMFQLLKRSFHKTKCDLASSSSMLKPLLHEYNDNLAENLDDSADLTTPELEYIHCDTTTIKYSFITRLKICFVKLLLLNYIPVAKFTFDMIHCVEVFGIPHLYIYGSMKCYVLWQKIIIGILIPWIILFPISVMISSLMLRKKQTSLENYLLMIAIPPYSFYFVAKKYFLGYEMVCLSKETNTGVVAMTATEDDLFKPKVRLVNWQVVILLRSLLITGLSTFVINPVYRLTAMLPIFGVCLLHDTSMPFRNEQLNNLQIVFTFTLLLLSTCNLVMAFSYINGLQGILDSNKFLLILKYSENFLILAPLPVWLLLWLLRNIYRKFTEKKKLE